MSDTPIADLFEEVMRQHGGFCCDEHRDYFRAMYFAGAMAAVHELTGWYPEENAVPVTVNKQRLAPLCAELAAAYNEPAGEISAEKAVHH